MEINQDKIAAHKLTLLYSLHQPRHRSAKNAIGNLRVTAPHGIFRFKN
ncbi:MAG: hypothetical protein V8Q43_02055 [Christensenellaceae bacterium]